MRRRMLELIVASFCETELRERRSRPDGCARTRLSFHGGLPRRVPRPGCLLVPQAEEFFVVSSASISDTSKTDVNTETRPRGHGNYTRKRDDLLVQSLNRDVNQAAGWEENENIRLSEKTGEKTPFNARTYEFKRQRDEG